MPTLVHIADAKLAKKISASGIIPDKRLHAVYFMPVTQNHFVSHQWLRELRRSGARLFVGIYFRLPDEEIVWAGKYNEPHQKIPLGTAIGHLLKLPDPLGYEIFVQRKILAKEITRVRMLPHIIGWRYMPHAHGRPLCGCPVCVPKGSIKGRKLRERLDPLPKQPPYESLKSTLRSSSNTDDLLTALSWLRGKRRRADPAFMQHLLNCTDEELLEELATTLANFKHPNTVRFLDQLAASTFPSVREAANMALRQLA